MSNRRAKRERSEIRNRGRLRFLLAVLSLEDLQRLGVVPKGYEVKPNATAIERMLDERLTTFRKADARLRKRPERSEQQPQAMSKVYHLSSVRWIRVVGQSQISQASCIRGKEATGLIVDDLYELPL